MMNSDQRGSSSSSSPSPFGRSRFADREDSLKKEIERLRSEFLSKSNFPHFSMFEPSHHTTTAASSSPFTDPGSNNGNVNNNSSSYEQQQQQPTQHNQSASQSNQPNVLNDGDPSAFYRNDPHSRFNESLHDLMNRFRGHGPGGDDELRFFRRFPDAFDNDVVNDDGKERRVHHIPIHIEPRPSGAATSSAASSRSREHSPNLAAAQSPPVPSQTPAADPYGHHYGQQIPQQYQQSPLSSNTIPKSHTVNIRSVPIIHQTQQPTFVAANPQQQQPQANEFYSKSPAANASGASAAGPRVIPIQRVYKSSSSPSAAANETRPQQPQQPTTQFTTTVPQTYSTDQQQYPVNESASDPLIADPNKVYAMSYEPRNDENKNEDNNKPPEVVVLSYEPNPNKQENMEITNEENPSKAATTSASKAETPFDYVDEILSDLHSWEEQVNECQATSQDDKGYKWLDEMLTLCVLRLDCINIDGNEELRKYRKQAINEVNRVVTLLESKIKKPTSNKSPSTNEELNAQDDKQDSNTKNNNKQQDNSSKKKDNSGGSKFSLFKKKKSNQSDTDRNNNDLKSDQQDQTNPSQQTTTSSKNVTIGKETEV